MTKLAVVFLGSFVAPSAEAINLPFSRPRRRCCVGGDGVGRRTAVVPDRWDVVFLTKPQRCKHEARPDDVSKHRLFRTSNCPLPSRVFSFAFDCLMFVICAFETCPKLFTGLTSLVLISDTLLAFYITHESFTITLQLFMKRYQIKCPKCTS